MRACLVVSTMENLKGDDVNKRETDIRRNPSPSDSLIELTRCL